MKRIALTLTVVSALAFPALGQCAEAAAKSYKVSEVFKNKASLDKKKVTVKGKVVKVAAGIMGKNWLHLQDGSGSKASKDNDLTVTTSNELPATGKEVTITGTVTKDKDFGSGYFYPVIIEDATIKQ